MNIKEIIIYGANKLKENNIQDSNIKARMLLQYVFKQDKSYLTINSEKQVDKKEEKIYKQYIQELIKGKPLQYITHTQEFMGLDFYVDENVLIPQPDTEILVEETIKEIEEKIENWEEIENEEVKMQVDKIKIPKKNDTIKILDMCTGSGAIAISIAKHFKEKYMNKNGRQMQEERQNIQVEVYGLDISEEALKIAKKNAYINGVNVTFFESDMFKQIKKHKVELFDIIVSNPPYIETNTIQTLSKEVKQEPHIALDGGEDGLYFYKIISKEASKYLKENGSILLEIGYNQKESVTKLFEEKQEYANIICIQDLSGNDRVIKLKRK